MSRINIYQYLDKLLNQPLCAIGRASNMLWLGIGKKIKILNLKGKQVEKSEISLHVQSMWRIIDTEKKEILLASSDFYSPRDNNTLYKDFVWDIQGRNLFDKKAPEWMEKANPVFIIDYQINSLGDLVLILSNNNRIEIYVNSSDDTESWRMLDNDYNKEHLVMTGKGVSYE